jgi:hypothetical protein
MPAIILRIGEAAFCFEKIIPPKLNPWLISCFQGLLIFLQPNYYLPVAAVSVYVLPE